MDGRRMVEDLVEELVEDLVEEMQRKILCSQCLCLECWWLIYENDRLVYFFSLINWVIMGKLGNFNLVNFNNSILTNYRSCGIIFKKMKMDVMYLRFFGSQNWNCLNFVVSNLKCISICCIEFFLLIFWSSSRNLKFWYLKKKVIIF